MPFRLPAYAAWEQRLLQPALFPRHPTPDLTTDPEPRPHCLSPLTAGMLAENLRLLEDGRGVGVRLWSQWPRMFAGLRALGEMLIITCSECAVLGKYMTYPELTTDPSHRLAGDLDGEFDFEFAHLHAASALHLRGAQGHNYGVEFLGADHQTLHKVCLNAESHFAAFLEWVQIHQALGVDPAPLWQRTMTAESPEAPAGAILEEARVFADPARLGDWLRAAVERGLPVQALVGNDAVVQGHCFVPRSVRAQGPWLFCSSDEVGLHLDPAKVVSLVLHNIAVDEPPCWTLKAYGPHGQLGLALAPTAPLHRSAWHALTREIFPNLNC